MGTNYYAVKKEPCLYDREIHIGKSSMGWRFNFHDCEWFHTFPQFKTFLNEHVETGEYVLMDEYEQKVEISDLLDLIEAKQKTPNDDDFAYRTRNIDGYRFTEGDFS